LTLVDSAGTATAIESIQIGNALVTLSNIAVDDSAGPVPAADGTYIALGIPFFFGKTISFGIGGAQTPLGPGPYVALPQ
jgi:hypothetical protein